MIRFVDVVFLKHNAQLRNFIVLIQVQGCGDDGVSALFEVRACGNVKVTLENQLIGRFLTKSPKNIEECRRPDLTIQVWIPVCIQVVLELNEDDLAKTT